MSRPVVLDTSVLIAAEHGRALAKPIPEKVAVSVVTLAELEVGVLVARDGKARAQRLATLTSVRQATAGLPADERVASAYARLAAEAIENGSKPKVHDTWIAATASVHGAEVWTRDADFTPFQGVDVVRL